MKTYIFWVMMLFGIGMMGLASREVYAFGSMLVTNGVVKKGDQLVWWKTPYGTFPFLNNHEMEFYSHGGVKKGRLAGRATWSDDTYGAFRFKGMLYFHENGRVHLGNVMGVARISLNGLPFNYRSIEFTPAGVVWYLNITRDMTWTNAAPHGHGTFTFGRHSYIYFHPNGALRYIRPIKTATWTNHKHGVFTFKKDWQIGFFSNGMVSNGQLDSDVTWSNNTYGAFTFKSNKGITFHEHGAVSYGTLERDTKIRLHGVSYTFQADRLIGFHSNGAVIQGYIGEKGYIRLYAKDGRLVPENLEKWDSAWTGEP